nr:MotA/TolQ/ExbB proton channel family protein [uncultured Desulfobulbus sp.]
MDIGALLKTFIYLVSSSLLYPVLLMLSILVLVVIVQAGNFFAEWLERTRLKSGAAIDLPGALQSAQTENIVSHRVKRYLKSLHATQQTAADCELAVENLLQSTTLELWKSMDKLRLLVRTGPSLGLIGTLIPMGTGLAALGQGDMTKLSSDLVIAFTTTVVGLAVGTVAFCFYTVRRRWLEEDIKNMELATELMMTNQAEH